MSKDIMQDIAKYIQGKVGKKYGFTVLIYEHGDVDEKARLNYISNSQRDDVVKAMKEFIEQTESGWGTHKL